MGGSPHRDTIIPPGTSLGAGGPGTARGGGGGMGRGGGEIDSSPELGSSIVTYWNGVARIVRDVWV